MASRNEVTLPASRPKSRKSLSHVPSSRDIGQENITTDLASLTSGKRKAQLDQSNRRSRSKSIGPGGLDALMDTSGNRRKSLNATSQALPRSILKPTIPLLREIPAHKSSRKTSPTKPSRKEAENSVERPPSGTTSASSLTGASNLANSFDIESSKDTEETRVTLRTEEEQQAAAREREEKDRQQSEKEAISRRDARRKSLANRRVSFAPEATLHTWDVVMEYQDSTTSSSGTRRASSVSGISEASPRSTNSTPNLDPSDPPSTPPEQTDEEETVTATPEHQRNLHQKKRRRSSAIPPMNFNNPDDEFLSSSPFSGDSAGDEEEMLEDDNSDSHSDSGDDDGTSMMSLDGDTTNLSVASIKSASSTGSHQLDEALKAAARQAGTRGIDFDEHGEQSEDESVVASFTPWSQRNPVENLESHQDQENVNPFDKPSQISKSSSNMEESDEEDMTMDVTHAVGGIIKAKENTEDDMSMDVTRAFGNIISNDVPKIVASQSASPTINRRQSKRRTSQESSMGDETMDLTMAIGGIQKGDNETMYDQDGDHTMDFTAVVGGVLSQSKTSPSKSKNARSSIAKGRGAQRESLSSDNEEATMEMTMAIGRVIQDTHDSGRDEDDETMGMDMSVAVGGILPSATITESRLQARKVMEHEADSGNSSILSATISNPSPQAAVSGRKIASETGSPSLAGFKGKGLRRSTGPRLSMTPKHDVTANSTPLKKPSTPSKQLTPQPQKPVTPTKSSPVKSVVMRSSSPKRLFRDELQANTTPQSAKPSKTMTPNRLFQHDKISGAATPSFVLTPKQRRSSGLGLDKVGLGSPRVAAILDRRRSIGEQAKSFTPGQAQSVSNIVRFTDPRIMENEVDDERAQEMAREDGRAILEREVDQAGDDKDATLNLKEMIQSLTPKKKSLKGRKSLHVGAATGLLGKRPVELDEDDEDEDEGGVKRLKGHQGSPVKNVRLQGPPSKAETTGRMTRAARKSLEQTTRTDITPTVSSPPKHQATTPKGQGRFKDVEVASTDAVPFLTENGSVHDGDLPEENIDDDRIQLQDFLNLTNIRFMELTTTKRRHTIAPRSSTKDFASETPASLEDCVAAGAATIPMLELFQHACAELKSYISEGRKTVREIETETFEENPPLFREYISATPDIKIFMDNQLKNVKTHARLLSKATWYEWRMTLLGTLKEGLIRSAEGMILDEEKLDEQQVLIQRVLPDLILQAENLRKDESDLQLAARELADCDPVALNDARQRLISADSDIVAKKKMISDLQRQLEEKEAEINAGQKRKSQCLEDIRDAENVREECRGWTSTEINMHKAEVDAIEKAHGWTITGSTGGSLSMTFLKDIELVFDPLSFSGTNNKKRQNARIDLWYIGAHRELCPQPSTPEKEFFLQSIRDHVRGLPQAETSVKALLDAVSSSWQKVNAVVNNIRILNIGYPSEVAKTSDSSIEIRSQLLIAPLQTKVETVINLESDSGDEGIEVRIHPRANVIYGERFNESKMGEFLQNRLGENVVGDTLSDNAQWSEAFAELSARLLARGRK